MGTLSIYINGSCFVLFDFICLPDCPACPSVGRSHCRYLCSFVRLSFCLFCVRFLPGCMSARPPARLLACVSGICFTLPSLPFESLTRRLICLPSCLSSLECKRLMRAVVFIPYLLHFFTLPCYCTIHFLQIFA